jgi:beta-aspartyl-dipeptidase (metallo-type)
MLQLISNANVFAPAPLGVCHILVAGGQIVYIGTDAPVLNTPLDVETTDLGGASVPPVHLSAFTTAGVTSVVGVLGTDDLTRNTQTLITQAYGLRALGLSAWCHTGGYHLPLTTLTGSARSDIVYIDPVIGVGELALSDHRSSQPTLDEFLRVASEAHVAGLMTGKAGIVHCHLGDGDRGLGMLHDALNQSEIPARVFNPTHINRNKALFEEALALAQHGCSIDLTAFPINDIGAGYSAAEAFLRYRAGDHPSARLTMSSDGGGCLPTFDSEGQLTHMGIGSPSTLIETVKDLAQTNIPLNEILPPLTSNVADLLKLYSKGRLECGKDADLVVLNDRHEIEDVMCLGRWHVRGGDAVIVGPYETG